MSFPLPDTTLCLLVRDDQVLLAMKKRGFGEGLWNGVGGKVNPGETIEQAAIRETSEEIGVTVKGLRDVGKLNFYFPEDKPDWNQCVHVFMVESWEGEPQESEEMRPRWFAFNQIPFDSMWEDDCHWLPLVLKGIAVEGDFHFNLAGKLLVFELREAVSA